MDFFQQFIIYNSESKSMKINDIKMDTFFPIKFLKNMARLWKLQGQKQKNILF